MGKIIMDSRQDQKRISYISKAKITLICKSIISGGSMKKTLYCLLILMLLSFCTPKKNEIEGHQSQTKDVENIYPLSNLTNPLTITMNNESVYIEDGTAVKVFSRGDFKYKKTIGRDGQGPGEFQDYATPQILSDKLMVSSSNKISYFTLAGEFIEDKKHTIFGSISKAIDNKYIGYNWVFEKDYIAYILYDSNIQPIKELHRGRALIHPNGRREFFEIFFCDTFKETIVLAHREGFTIEIFDMNGNLIHSIKQKIDLIPFTSADKESVRQYWIEERGYEQAQVELLESRTNFPKFYPPIQTCRLSDDKIYVITYKKKDNKFECLVFDLDGHFIDITYIPLNMLAPNLASPFTINEEFVYQLIFNYETDIWELHMNIL